MIYRVAVLSVILLAGGIASGQSCLDTRIDTNPCKIIATSPEGVSAISRWDGKWLVIRDQYRFQVIKDAGHITGNFFTTIVAKIPQPADIIEAPQFEMMEIYGNCSSKTYQITAFGITNSQGFFQTTEGGEDVTRRVMTGTPIEVVFYTTCVSALLSQEKQSGLSPGFQTYTNNRYGFRVDYPLTFIPEAPPDNGDGLSFKSQDGKATLGVSGSNNAGFTLKDEFDSAIKNVHGQLGYTKTGGSWFVVTWTDGGNIGYTKEFVGPGSQNSFTITFPVEQKSQYDSVVTAIEKSFQPGDLDNSH